MHKLAEALQETFVHEIPLTTAIGMRVAAYDGVRLALSAPLEPNLNHKATAFAGSLNSVVTLAGWGLIWIVLHEQGLTGTIVIQDSSCQYRKPVTRDFTAVCYKPDEAQLAQFIKMVREKGRGRLELSVEIRQEETITVSFVGRYVVHASLLHRR